MSANIGKVRELVGQSIEQAAAEALELFRSNRLREGMQIFGSALQLLHISGESAVVPDLSPQAQDANLLYHILSQPRRLSFHAERDDGQWKIRAEFYSREALEHPDLIRRYIPELQAAYAMVATDGEEMVYASRRETAHSILHAQSIEFAIPYSAKQCMIEALRNDQLLGSFVLERSDQKETWKARNY